MSFRIRAARPDDFRALYDLGQADRRRLHQPAGRQADARGQARRGRRPASRAIGENQADDLYVFVLEDVETKAIRGTCQIFGQVGTDRPFYSYRLSTLTQKSEELGRIFRNQTLNLSTDLEGSTEVGGLFLHPHERAGGLGMLLARSRYLFIKQHRPRFGAARAGRASRGDGPGRQFAVLGRARRALLRHDLSRGRRVQRRPRHPVHRRSDAQDADLCRDAARQRALGDGPAAPDRPRGAEDARGRRLPVWTATSTFSTAGRRSPRRPTRSARSSSPNGCATPGRRSRARRARRCCSPAAGWAASLACYGQCRARQRRRGLARRPDRRRAAARPRRPRAGRAALMAIARDQFRRDHRAEPQLCRPQPRQPRLDAQRRRRVAAARGGAAGARQDARQSGARAGAGPVRAASRGRRATGSARSARHRGRRARACRQRDVRLGDVGGQCRDGQPRARHRRRPLPPDRRQSAHHAAPQPRMAGDAGAAAARLRRRGLRGARAGAAGVRRRGRGQSHAARRAHGEPGVEVFVYGRSGGAFPARQHVEASKAIARLHRLDPERTLFVEQSEEAIAAGAFHNDVVAVANERVLLSRTSRPSPTATPCSPTIERLMPEASRSSRWPRPRCRSPTRSDPICSTPSW